SFATRGPGFSAEVFAGDDVGGRLRPALGHFHVFLAEDGYSLFVANQRGALFPFDRVERRFLPVGEIPSEDQTCLRPAHCVRSGRIRGRRFSAQCMLHCSHPFLRASGVPPTCGEPYYFTPLRPVVLPRFASGSGLKRTQLDSASS